jgi:hypothetical protein
MDANPKSWIGKLVGACVGLLAGSIALYAAVRLLEAIWSTLLIILGGGLLLAVLVAALRARSRGW